MPKKITSYPLLPLIHRFINELKKGKHLQTNGKKLKSSSIQNYKYLELLLVKYCNKKNVNLRLRIITDLNKKQFDLEKKYWKYFYLDFTNYLYNDLKHFDNHVGRMIKLLRSFFNFLINEKGMNIGFFHKKFYSPSEDVEIIVLAQERINYLIYNTEMEKLLSDDLRKVKDIFVFGCAVALRFSDLIALSKSNLENINDRFYIKIQSKKTQTFTRVKLPIYAAAILNKYSKCYSHKILPPINKVVMNKKIKKLMEIYGFTEQHDKYRQRRGISEKLFKNKNAKTGYRFCDLISTHTMRRTAITNLLSEGLNEQMVRQISGHAANSKEFFRYVAFAQTFIDTEIDKVHERLSKKLLVIA
jgi:integrase